MQNMETSSFIITTLLAIFVMTLAVILFVVLYQRKVIKHHIELKMLNTQKELEILKASIQSEEEERKRIATELHDDVGATLSSARLFLNSANTDISRDQIHLSKSLIDDSLNKIRAVSYKLQPSSLITLGLQSAIKNNIDILNKSGQIEAIFLDVEGFPRIDSYTELHVYRIVQEVITNVTKHANAKELTIEMLVDCDLQIRIHHNGDGMTSSQFENLAKSSTGQGLRNIKNRIRIVNGEIEHSFENGLFVILICIPRTNEKTKE